MPDSFKEDPSLMKCERMMSLNGIVVSVISSYTCTCVYIINDFVIHTPVTVSRNSTGISYASSSFFFFCSWEMLHLVVQS